MIKTRLFSIILMLWSVTFLYSEKQDKIPIIVLTDIGGDTDDEQSMVRLLLYANQLDIKALCATSRLEHGQDVKPGLIHQIIEAYGKVYQNLQIHSSGYPTPEYLHSVVFSGQGDQKNAGANCDTEASQAIIRIVTEASGKIHIAVWGGQRELYQALWRARENLKKEEFSLFCSKMQVHAIGNQDGYRDKILTEFKDVKYVSSGFVNNVTRKYREISVYRGMYMTGDNTMQSAAWVNENIRSHGALGQCYQLNGHGTDGMKEGDTPSFLGLIPNGLNIPEHPEYGGWGGRFRPIGETLYVDAADVLDGSINERHTVSRWRKAFQHDFMARMDWCITDKFDKANHSPVIRLKKYGDSNPIEVESAKGEQIKLDASLSEDPDNDQLSYKWYLYDEISMMGEGVQLIASDKPLCKLKISPDFRGETIHLILEVTDNGTPELSTYKRVQINVCR